MLGLLSENVNIVTTCPDVPISKLLFKIHMQHLIMLNMQNSLFPNVCISAVCRHFSRAYLNIHARAAYLFDRYSDVRITGFSTFSCQSARVPIRREVSFPLKLSSGLYCRSDFTPSGNGPACFVFSLQGPFCCRAPYARQGAQRLVAPALAVNTSGLEWGKEGYEGVDAFLQSCSGVNGMWVSCRSKRC